MNNKKSRLCNIHPVIRQHANNPHGTGLRGKYI